MRHIIIAAFLLSGAAKAETYNECILKNMKGVGSQAGAYLVNKACREKVLPHMPAKCRVRPWELNWNTVRPVEGQVYAEQVNQKCIESCLNASYWSRHFGECAP